VGQKRVGRDVERDPEGDVAGALCEVDVQPAALDAEDEGVVTGRQRRDGGVSGVPGVDDDPARSGVLPELVEGVGDLVERAVVVHPAVIVVGPGLPRQAVLAFGDRVAPPEPAVSGVEPALLVRPGVPDRRLLAEVADVLLPRQVPQELVDERVPPDAREVLRREEGEPLPQVDLVVPGETRDRVHAGPVRLVRPLREDARNEVEVLLHWCGPGGRAAHALVGVGGRSSRPRACRCGRAAAV
jgi:hypothetical protein